MRKTALLTLLLVSFWANAHTHTTVITEKNTDEGIEKKLYKTQKLVITTSDWGRISLWDANTGYMKSSVLIPQGLIIQKAIYNQKENFVAVVCAKTPNTVQLFIWKPETDEQKFVQLSLTKQANDIIICEDKINIIVSYTDNSLEYIELSTQKKLLSIGASSSTINSKNIVINTSQNLMVVPYANGEVGIYNTQTQAPVKKLLGINAQRVTFSSNGKLLLIVTGEKVKIYDTQTWELTAEKDAATLERAEKKRVTNYDKL